jgi:hypothetical protein
MSVLVRALLTIRFFIFLLAYEAFIWRYFYYFTVSKRILDVTFYMNRGPFLKTSMVIVSFPIA